MPTSFYLAMRPLNTAPQGSPRGFVAPAGSAVGAGNVTQLLRRIAGRLLAVEGVNLNLL